LHPKATRAHYLDHRQNRVLQTKHNLHIKIHSRNIGENLHCTTYSSIKPSPSSSWMASRQIFLRSMDNAVVSDQITSFRDRKVLRAAPDALHRSRTGKRDRCCGAHTTRLVIQWRTALQGCDWTDLDPRKGICRLGQQSQKAREQTKNIEGERSVLHALQVKRGNARDQYTAHPRKTDSDPWDLFTMRKDHSPRRANANQSCTEPTRSPKPQP